MSRIEQSVRLLHGLGYLYGRYGQQKRAIVLLLIGWVVDRREARQL